MTLRQTRDGLLVDTSAPPGVDFSPSGFQEYLDMSRQGYFLLRLRGVDVASRCGRCRARHEYFTLMCVERPWKGNWMDALYGYASVTKDDGLYGEIVQGLKDLRTVHPRTANGMDTRQEVVAVPIFDAVEWIDEWKARALAQRINEIGSMGRAWKPFILE